LKRFLNFFSKKFGLRKIKIGASEKTFFREVFPNFFSKRFSKFFGNTSRKNILQNAFGFFLDHFQENIDTGCYKWAHICSTVYVGSLNPVLNTQGLYQHAATPATQIIKIRISSNTCTIWS